MRLAALFGCLALTRAMVLTAARSSVASMLSSLPLCKTSMSQQRWIAAVDKASGQTYWYSQQTGESRWELPQDAGAQQHQHSRVEWHVVPNAGVSAGYTVRCGEEQVLGRWDMMDHSLYVSRKQCLVQVAEDGSAALVSLGKPLTLYRVHNGAPWSAMRRSRPLGDDIGFSGTHALADGEQISLDMRNPEGAVFTVFCRVEGAGHSNGSYGGQYKDDESWMWNGVEWIPA